MKKLNTLLVIAFIAILTACSKDDAKTEPITNPVTETPANVYVVGYEGIYPAVTQKLWTNDVGTTINEGKIKSIFVKGFDIYTCVRQGNGGSSTIKYSKNGVYTEIRPTINQEFPNVNDIAVDNNNNIYIVGQLAGKATLWIFRADGTSVGIRTFSNEISEIFAVETYNDNVYMVGYERSSTSYNKAKYWKLNSSISINLTTEADYDGAATSITIKNGNIYIAGYSKDNSGKAIVKYWKNQNLTNIAEDHQFVDPYGRSLQVHIGVTDNEDVYIAGSQYTPSYQSSTGQSTNKAIYWKNGIKYDLSNGVNFENTTGIATIGNDVYISGFDNNFAKYWKNGAAKILSIPTSTYGDTSSIFVTKK
jgi:major membrane immunogen (membrane-anchored lipoprotein)